MLRARPQAVKACRRGVSYWRAAKSIALSHRKAARAEVPTPAPATQSAPPVLFKSAFPPGLSQEHIGELQLRQLEEDAVFLTSERPELISVLAPVLGKDAMAGAAVMREALQAIADKRPKLIQEPGRSLPDQDQLAEWSDQEAVFRTLQKDTVKAAMPRVREEAMRVRKEEGMSEQPTLLPPVAVDVPAHYLASQVDHIAQRIEYFAIIYLGFLWKHFLLKIPPALQWVANFRLRTLFQQLTSTPGIQSPKAYKEHFAARLKEIDPRMEFPPRLTRQVIKDALKLWREARKNHKEIRAAELVEEQKHVAELKKKLETDMKIEADAKAAAKKPAAPGKKPAAEPAEEPELALPEAAGPPRFGFDIFKMPTPRTVDPRDWGLFLLNRVVYYWAYVSSSFAVLRETNPYLAEETKKYNATVKPALEKLREDVIEALKEAEEKPEVPWDPKEIVRVRTHGMQEKMTTKEAALILGMTNADVLTGDYDEQDVKEAHRAVMRQNHPDTLGSNYLALKINKAKEVLTKGSGIEGEENLHKTEEEERKKLADPEYLDRQRRSSGLDSEAEAAAQFDKEAAAAISAKMRAKRKIRSWYWHKNPLWRRLLGLGPEFFPIQKEAFRMYYRMRKKRQRREIGRLYRRTDQWAFGQESHKVLEYRNPRAIRFKHKKFTKLREPRQWQRYFSYWFYWRLSRPIPLLWRVPFFVFVRVPLLITLFPLAVLGFAIYYPVVVLWRVLKPIPAMLIKPFPPMFYWVYKTIRDGFKLPDKSEEAQEMRKERLSGDLERFMSKNTLRRIWRRFSDALYRRANVEEAVPEWDPEFLKRAIREELRTVKRARQAFKRYPRAFETDEYEDEDDASEEAVEANEPDRGYRTPAETELEKEDIDEIRKASKQRFRRNR